MLSNRYQLTPEQITLSEERKRLKLLKQKDHEQTSLDAAPSTDEDPRGKVLPREWVQLQKSSSDGAHIVKVMTWNLLAQTLVRRSLFPASDCLKGSQREHMLFREIFSHGADIMCLQELDQVDKIFPRLEQAGYSYIYKTGHKKRHGSLIAYRKAAYTLVEERKIEYDVQLVRPESQGGSNISDKTRRGSAFWTKNIGNLVALRRNADAHDGLIVATTHLFWHPRYTYERARQVAILIREVDSLRQELKCSHWPCIVAGDFNFQPDDAAYSLLMGDPLIPEQIDRLALSRVVHLTIDPTVPKTSDKPVKDDEEGGDGAEEETDPDLVIVNARRAVPHDGLLSDAELVQMFSSLPRAISAYDEGLKLAPPADVKDLTFGSRVSISDGRCGGFEPIWTSYTHYWKTVLDYIFVLSPPERPVTVTGIAKPHSTDKLDPGIPRKGVCGSDHISLCAELSWPARSYQ